MLYLVATHWQYQYKGCILVAFSCTTALFLLANWPPDQFDKVVYYSRASDLSVQAIAIVTDRDCILSNQIIYVSSVIIIDLRVANTQKRF